MSTTENQDKDNELTSQFVYFATEVSNLFPDLDLRFNLEHGSNLLRFTIPAVTKEIFELALDPENVVPSVYEAAFTIKELTKRFDA